MVNFQPKQHSDGPDKWVFGSGSTLEIDDAATVSVDGDDYTGAEFKALLAAIADLPTENVASPAIWNDAGVLKVGTA